MNVFQSVAERAPVVVEFAVRIPNTPVRLLYVSGHTAERAVSPILVATVDERVERVPDKLVTLLFVVARFELRVDTVPESEATVEFVVERLPESEVRFELVVARFVFVVVRVPESVEILDVLVAMFEVLVATCQ